MSGPSLDLEKPNALGGLDRLVTNFALALIAVVPTFLTCVVRPRRLTPLLKKDDPDGRDGMLLAPGAFFPLVLLVAFFVAALLATPETLRTNGSFIGPDLAVAVQSAAAEGDVWKVIGTILPLYIMAIFVGVLGAILKPWAGENWTLRVSLRAAFYVSGALVSWLLLTSAGLDLYRVSTGRQNVGGLIYGVFVIPTLLVIIRMYFSFFRDGGSVSKVKSGALSLAMIGLFFAPIILTDLLMRMTS